MKLYIRKIEEYWDSDTELLEKDRRNRLKRITNPKVRAECIAAGMLLREALADYGYPVGKKPLDLEYDENGKPKLKRVENERSVPQFSISHSGQFVVCAVDDEEVGVDVQEVKKVSARLPRRVLSESELSEYQRLLESDKRSEALSYFTVRWTEKESIAKLNGKGIGMDFRTIETGNYRLHTVFRSESDTAYVITTAQYR